MKRGLLPLAVLIVCSRPEHAVAALERLLNSERIRPMEGYRFLALSTGPVGNPVPEGGGQQLLSETVPIDTEYPHRLRPERIYRVATDELADSGRRDVHPHLLHTR